MLLRFQHRHVTNNQKNKLLPGALLSHLSILHLQSSHQTNHLQSYKLSLDSFYNEVQQILNMDSLNIDIDACPNENFTVLEK